MASGTQHGGSLLTASRSLAIPRGALGSVVAASSTAGKVSMGDKLMVGAVAGVVGVALTYPLDYTKTRLQSVGKPGAPVFTGPVHVWKHTFENYGPKGFYRGLHANLIGVSPEKAIKLAVNDIMREYLSAEDGSIALLDECLAGSTAGFVQVVATNPMEIVKIRLQNQIFRPATEQQTAMQVVRHLGLKGMYRGTMSTLMRDVPFSFLFFPLYAKLNAKLSPSDGPPSILGTLVAGCASGAVSAAAVTPLDVIKTRLQEEGGRKKYGNWAGVARTLAAEGNPLVFFSGASVRALTIAPLFGIALVAFELQKAWIAERNAIAKA